ncbi:MAG: phage protein Gp27 family protein [Alphaproteobacteria bacterium]
MPAPSKIERLPADTKARVDKFLGAHPVCSVDDFLAFLVAEIGLDIGRSSAHRYQQGFAKVAEKMHRSRAMAEALAQEIGPDALQGKQARLLIEMFQTIVFRDLSARLDAETEDGEEAPGMDAKDAMMLGRAIKDAVAAQALDAERERKVRKDEREKAATAAADKVAELGRGAGLSAATIAEWREKVLGIAREAPR